MTESHSFTVPANAMHLVVLDPMRTVVAIVDLVAERPKGIYLPKGDALHWVDDDSNMKFVFRPSPDKDASVDLYYEERSEPHARWDTQRYTGSFDNKLGSYDGGPVEVQEFSATDARNGEVEGSSQPPILKYFEYMHLPIPLRIISGKFYDLAHDLNRSLPDGPEKSAGLRKLLEAKDCFVRAAL